MGCCLVVLLHGAEVEDAGIGVDGFIQVAWLVLMLMPGIVVGVGVGVGLFVLQFLPFI